MSALALLTLEVVIAPIPAFTAELRLRSASDVLATGADFGAAIARPGDINGDDYGHLSVCVPDDAGRIAGDPEC